MRRLVGRRLIDLSPRMFRIHLFRARSEYQSAGPNRHCAYRVSYFVRVFVSRSEKFFQERAADA